MNEDESLIRGLYQGLLESWNRRDAATFATLFVDDGTVIGFDGSQMEGAAEIASSLGDIFAYHRTGAYVSKIRSVRFPTPDVALLRAVVGMVPANGRGFDPALNALQTLVAVRKGVAWLIILFQNTPAAFHGRPEEAEKLTEELRGVLRGGGI